jgi:Nif11 domain
MKSHVQRFVDDVASDPRMQESVRPLLGDVARIVQFANARGYVFSIEDLEALADHHDRASDPFVGLRRQGWQLKPHNEPPRP